MDRKYLIIMSLARNSWLQFNWSAERIKELEFMLQVIRDRQGVSCFGPQDGHRHPGDDTLEGSGIFEFFITQIIRCFLNGIDSSFVSLSELFSISLASRTALECQLITSVGSWRMLLKVSGFHSFSLPDGSLDSTAIGVEQMYSMTLQIS